MLRLPINVVKRTHVIYLKNLSLPNVNLASLFYSLTDCWFPLLKGCKSNQVIPDHTQF